MNDTHATLHARAQVNLSQCGPCLGAPASGFVPALPLGASRERGGDACCEVLRADFGCRDGLHVNGGVADHCGSGEAPRVVLVEAEPEASGGVVLCAVVCARRPRGRPQL